MSRARRRNSTNSPEALLKAVMAVFIFVALAIGGIGHFAQVLTGLIYGALLLAMFGSAAFLIIISRLVALKKAALLLVLAAIALGLFWRARIAPTPWPATQATVIRVVEPSYTANCTYEYVTGGQKFPFNTSHTWASVDEAKRRTPTELTLYINPMNPAEATDKSTTRWIRTTAKLTHGDVNPDGVFEANARYFLNLTSYQAVFRGEGARRYKVGTQFTLWLNPNNPEDVSVESKQNPAEKHTGLLASAIACGLLGVGLIIYRGKHWREPRSETTEPPSAAPGTPPQLPTQARSREFVPPLPPATTEDALRRIDWFQFEKVCARLLQFQGWEVSHQGGSHPDGGADLIAKRGDRTAVVQCKHWKNWEVPPKILRELLGTKGSVGFNADDAILFTLSPCSVDAMAYATANKITVYGADSISAEIDAAGVTRFPELLKPDDKRCPKCGSPMLLRESARGSFWGCSQFGATGCRGKFEADGTAG